MTLPPRSSSAAVSFLIIRRIRCNLAFQYFLPETGESGTKPLLRAPASPWLLRSPRPVRFAADLLPGAGRILSPAPISLQPLSIRILSQIQTMSSFAMLHACAVIETSPPFVNRPSSMQVAHSDQSWCKASDSISANSIGQPWPRQWKLPTWMPSCAPDKVW